MKRIKEKIAGSPDFFCCFIMFSGDWMILIVGKLDRYAGISLTPGSNSALTGKWILLMEIVLTL